MASSSLLEWHGLLLSGRRADPGLPAHQRITCRRPCKPTKKYVGAHAPSISANGNTNGVLWILSGNNLDALDAVSLNLLYSSSESGDRDKFPKPAHFATQTVANGRVYVGHRKAHWRRLGCFTLWSVIAGNNQSRPVLNPLPAPLQIATTDPYNGQPISGVTITFSDGKRVAIQSVIGSYSSDGTASTTYTVSKKDGVYTLTASAANFGSVTATETATAAASAKTDLAWRSKTDGPAGTVLPAPLKAEV